MKSVIEFPKQKTFAAPVESAAPCQDFQYCRLEARFPDPVRPRTGRYLAFLLGVIARKEGIFPASIHP